MFFRFNRPDVDKPTVCIYGVNYRPEPTGIGPYTAELAEELVRQGERVRVVTTFPHYPAWKVADGDRWRWRRREVHDGVSVVRLWSRMPRPMTGAQRTLFEVSYLISALLHGPGRARTVVGVVPGLGSGLGAAIHTAVRRSLGRQPRRLVIVVQDLAGQGLRQSGLSSNRGLASLAMKAEAFALRRADTVLAISPTFVHELETLGVRSNRITVLPNWSRLGLHGGSRPSDSSQITILHAGSMGLKQGLEQLIDAARIARVSQRTWRFVLVGDGSERARLERLAADLPNVRFEDPVPEDRFPALLSSASLLVVSQAPSNMDMSFPSKLTSYFAASRPVVACVPTGGAVDRFLHTTNTGITSPAGDAPALVAALASLLKDRVLYNELVDRARCHVETNWDREERLRSWVRAITPDNSIPEPR